MLQYLDDLDDLYATIGLLAEKLRSIVLLALFYTAALIMQLAGILLALRHPHLALAISILLFVILLNVSVWSGPRNLRHSA